MTIINIKHDTGKSPVGDLAKQYPASFELLAYVLSYSKIKYGFATGFLYLPDNFQENQNKIYNSVVRHLISPFSLDQETGLPQLVQSLTQLLFYREREFKHDLEDQYIDQIKMLYGEEACRTANDKAKFESKPEIWLQKWTVIKKEMLEDPFKVPVSEVFLRTSQALNTIAFASQEYKNNHQSANEKFLYAGNILENNYNEKLIDKKFHSYDIAATMLFDVIQQKYPDPKVFLQ